ncbi:hypothetical protein MMC14_001306 [Varicellaria rhodocarpa]|nr:hypothetical protein [Varicellaria rhodocarpa]
MEPRWPYRSSKSYTNGSPSSIPGLTPLSIESDTSPSTDYISAGRTSEAVVTSPTGDAKSRKDSRHRIRAHLFSNSDLSLPESSDEDSSEGRSGILEAARGVRNRLSRTSTIVSQLPSARRSRSLISHPQSLASTASIGQELDDDQILDHIKERAFFDQLAALNHVSSPVDEDPHTESTPSPIRRKSLLTPGIATRTPNDILRKPPQVKPPSTPAIQDYYFNPSLSTSSPLSRLAGFGMDSKEEASAISRAATPSDLDYTHLGGLKLGTLRITNGSDTKSLLDHSYSPHLHLSEDHFIPSKSGHNEGEEDELIRENVHRFPNGESIGWIGTPGRSHICSSEISRKGRPIENEMLGAGCSGSPLKQQQLETNFSSEQQSIGSRPAIPLYSTDGLVSSSAKSCELQDVIINRGEGYTSELPSSPFALPNGSPARMPTYEGNFHRDQLYHSDCASESPFGGPSVHCQWNAFTEETEKRHYSGKSFASNFSIANASKTSLSYSSSESRPVSSSTLSDNPPQVGDADEPKNTMVSAGKHDSGYSSCTSVRSLGQPMRPASQSYNRKFFCTPEASKVPEEHYLTTSLTKSSLSTPNPDLSPSSPSLTNREKPIIDRSASDFPSQIVPEVKSVVEVTPLTIKKTSRSFRKLRKARPVSQPPSVSRSSLQDWQDLSQMTIPPIPLDIAARHAKRQDQFPLLEHTFPSLQHTHSRDGSTSPDLVFVPIRFPSPNNDSLEDSMQSNKSMKVASKNPVTSSPRRTSWRDYTSITRLKSQRRRSQSPYANGTDIIADLGTVTESLGRSPYDIARSTQSAESHAAGNVGLSHPHQMTTATPRAKITSGMNDAYAAQLMRSRSQYKVEGLAASYGTVDDRQGRPRSLMAEPTESQASSSNLLYPLSGDGKLKSLKKPRPQSMFADVPAVPQTYSTKQIVSATPSLASSFRQDGDSSKMERHESMIVHRSMSDTIPVEQLGSRSPSRRSFNDSDKHPGKMPRPKSMYTDIPPVPALPTAVQVELKEAQIYRSNFAQQQPPHKTPKVTTLIKTNEVLKAPTSDEESRKPTDGLQSWEAQSQAWSKLRALARNEVIKRAQTPKVVTPMEDDFSTSQPPRKLSTARPSSVGSPRPDQHLNVPRKCSKSSEVSSTPPLNMSASNDSTTSLQSSASSGSHVQRLSGRYEGGYFFGYEPGFGLGGSAGTRNVKSGATRKSVDVSVEYGLDLSDLPIMVRPR